MNFFLKWGCDGSSGQSQYKQKFSSSGASDSSVFLTSLVPLQLTAIWGTKEVIIWKNPRPSSARYSRPIRLQFVQENKDVANHEVKYINEQIKNLKPFNAVVDGKLIQITYKLLFTMIDGKIINALTDTTSAMRCHLCNATSSLFNDIDDMLQREVNTANLCYGISSLHAWIRFYEMFLKIGYKQDLQTWQARKEKAKENVAKRKQIIQKGFQEQLGLLVDHPKSGFGSTNDGNTARRFFQNSTVSAQILGVDEEVISRCHTILQVLASGYAINVAKFKEYCEITARRIVELYPWYNMPTSVHKVLIHGYKVVEWAPLPIGQLSEEAQESRNKDIKAYRENFARKTSRVSNVEDIFNRMLVSSDPIISEFSNTKPKSGKTLSSDALKLLDSPIIERNNVLLEMFENDDEDSVDSE